MQDIRGNAFYQNVRRSRLCNCGAYKLESDPFCHSCESLLGRPVRLALIRKCGKGFEEAYDVAWRQIWFWREWANIQRQHDDRQYIEAMR